MPSRYRIALCSGDALTLPHPSVNIQAHVSEIRCSPSHQPPRTTGGSHGPCHFDFRGSSPQTYRCCNETAHVLVVRVTSSG